MTQLPDGLGGYSPMTAAVLFLLALVLIEGAAASL